MKDLPFPAFSIVNTLYSLLSNFGCDQNHQFFARYTSKSPIFREIHIKITNFSRDTHNANSSLFLLFTHSDSQYLFNLKRFHPNSSCVSRNISRSVEVGIWFLANINGYLEWSNASVTSCLSHCSLSFLINYLVFWRFACCKPRLCEFNLSKS